MNTFLQILGFVAAAFAVGGYFVANQRDQIQIFNVVNFLTSIVLVPLGIYFGTYFAASLSAAYGVIGLYEAILHWKKK